MVPQGVEHEQVRVYIRRNFIRLMFCSASLLSDVEMAHEEVRRILIPKVLCTNISFKINVF